MKTRGAAAGPFKEKPYYSLDDIEQMCWDELHKAGLYPEMPSAIRIDRFVEKRFGVTIAYEDLPKGLLGFTEFGREGVVAVVVSKTLDDGYQSSERRMRTTLAHEGGHGLLHTHLLVLGQDRSMFEGAVDDQQRLLCREDGSSNRKAGKYDGKWWEHQANLAMSSLLLPRGLVDLALEPVLTSNGALGVKAVASERRNEAVSTLAEVFDVNPVVARIRLDVLYPESRQLTL